jgi:hypothetical protein
MTVIITDACACGHLWHEDPCRDRRTVADIRGGTKHEDCTCERGRPLTDPAAVRPSHFYVEAWARSHLGLVPPPRALAPAAPAGEDPPPRDSAPA